MLSLSEIFSGNGIFTLALIIILGICVLIYKDVSKPKGMPPGPFRIPIVGHLPLLGSSQYITLTKFGKKYGSIYR